MSMRFLLQAVSRGIYEIPIPASAVKEELKERYVRVNPKDPLNQPAGLEDIFGK